MARTTLLPARPETLRRLAAPLALCAALGLASSAAALDDAPSSLPAPEAALSGAALVRALRDGGHVVYLRHTATDFSQPDGAMSGYDDCANQRPLSPLGREQARRIGEQVRALALPVSDVLASPYCRTMEHATLAFGRATPTPDLREGHDGDFPGLKALLAQPVAPGEVRWIVGHGTPFRLVAGPPHLEQGEAVVLHPEATHWRVVARIPVEGWAALVDAAHDQAR